MMVAILSSDGGSRGTLLNPWGSAQQRQMEHEIQGILAFSLTIPLHIGLATRKLVILDWVQLGSGTTVEDRTQKQLVAKIAGPLALKPDLSLPRATSPPTPRLAPGSVHLGPET